MTTEEVQTLTLRFRDLGIDPGKTISAHRAMIKKYKYAWWGWWNKFGERIPVEVFSQLAARAAEAEIEIFLLDSGRRELRRARLRAISFSEDLSRQPAPEGGLKTPEYYRDQQFFAWFKLTAIDAKPRDPKEVKELTYVGVDSFFEAGASPFRQFYGQRIRSLDELIAQNRTIWFVRQRRPGDRTEPLPEVDETAPYRTPFPKSWAASPSNSLLLLSDLHFGHHAFPLVESVYESSLALRIERDLKDFGKHDLAGIVVAGDLSWKADAAEFEEALTFFGQLRRWSTLDFSRYVICPGNHDLRFSEDPSDKTLPVSVAPEEARRPYADFYRKFFEHSPGGNLSMGRRYLLGGGQRVEVAALNSSLLQQEPDRFQGHGFLGARQLQEAASELGWPSRNELRQQPQANRGPRAFRVVVLHHHLLPVPFREVPYPEHRTSIVFDAEAFARWLVDRQVDLVIHGHMHEPFICKLSRPIPLQHGEPWHDVYVLGLGSAGVKDDHLPKTERSNTYGLLEFRPEAVRVGLRRVDSQGALQEGQKQVWIHEIPYPAAVR